MKLKHWWSTGFAVVLLTTQAAGQIDSRGGLSEEDWKALYLVARATVLVERSQEASDRAHVLMETGSQESWTAMVMSLSGQPTGRVRAAVREAQLDKEIELAQTSAKAAREAAREARSASEDALWDVMFNRDESEWSLVQLRWLGTIESQHAAGDAYVDLVAAMDVLLTASAAAGKETTVAGARSSLEEVVPFKQRADAATAAVRQTLRNDVAAWDELLAAVVAAIVPDPESRAAVLAAAKEAARIAP